MVNSKKGTFVEEDRKLRELLQDPKVRQRFYKLMRERPTIRTKRFGLLSSSKMDGAQLKKERETIQRILRKRKVKK